MCRTSITEIDRFWIRREFSYINTKGSLMSMHVSKTSCIPVMKIMVDIPIIDVPLPVASSWRHTTVLLFISIFVEIFSWEEKHFLSELVSTSTPMLWATTLPLLHSPPTADSLFKNRLWRRRISSPMQSNKLPLHTVAPAPQTVHMYTAISPGQMPYWPLICTRLLPVLEPSILLLFSKLPLYYI